MAKMTINYNNLRKQAIYSYESLVEKLNNSIIKKNQHTELSDGEYSNVKGFVLIDAKEIQKDIDNLRKMIGAIAMTSVEGEEEFKDVYQEVFPDEDQSMKLFNDEAEDGE